MAQISHYTINKFTHGDNVTTDALRALAEGRGDQRIRYRKLSGNLGLAGNTNEALKEVRGSYTGLLDHDDLLTPDALYEMARALRESRKKGIDPVFLYSDEDKCDGERWVMENA